MKMAAMTKFGAKKLTIN